MEKAMSLLPQVPRPTGNCVRIGLIIQNVLYVLAGIVAVGVGARILVREESYLVAFFGYNIMNRAAGAIVALGIIAIITALMGITALRFQQTVVFLVYIILVTIILIFMFFGGIVSLLYKNSIGVTVKQNMVDSLLYQYRFNMSIQENAHMTEVWDRLQTEEYCCSVEDDSWNIYQRSNWFKEAPGTLEVDKPLVPKSCCVYDHNFVYLDLSKCQNFNSGPPGQETGIQNRAVHYRGCFNAGEHLGLDYFSYVATIGFLATIVMIVGQILSICYYRQLGDTLPQ